MFTGSGCPGVAHGRVLAAAASVSPWAAPTPIRSSTFRPALIICRSLVSASTS
ncbi:hypothetical protein Ae168Ps1_2707c [Pseudonocardia sp. Ae168_Ps1]|nr:hypothetical protein Ae168Ps1_2707c [Pseudonocardia sp. Ae168_Ps1]OLL85568.1 hypothetical protein Ae263Ps1_2623c [Pseudonocardia sp. Ae263_Ps1]